jgi:hypothetical protein
MTWISSCRSSRRSASKPILRDLAAREGLGLVGAFHKRKATFWATLERYRRRETAHTEETTLWRSSAAKATKSDR